MVLLMTLWVHMRLHGETQSVHNQERNMQGRHVGNNPEYKLQRRRRRRRNHEGLRTASSLIITGEQDTCGLFQHHP